MPGRSLLILLAAVILLVAGFFLVRGREDEETSASTSTPTGQTVEPAESSEPESTTGGAAGSVPAPVALNVRIVDGRAADGIVRATAHKGDTVRVSVRGDVSDEVHVHGYDLKADVAPGDPAEIDFRATLTGRFEIELEGAGRQIAQLTVLP